MLNLYTNEHKNGFMGLMGANARSLSMGLKNDTDKIISGFKVLSLLFLLTIANASQYQTSVEQQRFVSDAAHTTIN